VERIRLATEMNKTAEDSFQRIVTGITDLADALAETAAGMDEVSLGSQSIVKALGPIRDITGEVRRSSREISDSAVGKTRRMSCPRTKKPAVLSHKPYSSLRGNHFF
jgi:methyl-accepting chemotaxis protein